MLGGIIGGVLGGLGGLFGGSGKNKGLERSANDYKGYAKEDRNRYVDLLGRGQTAFETSARSAVDAALPSFQQELQGIRENAIARGISTGDLGTSYEGDLANSFQKNVANSISGQAMNLYGTQLGAAGQMASESGNNYLDLLAGNADRQQAGRNSGLNFFSSLAGPLAYMKGSR